jgi:16S rRNA (cytosine1402-N4)-methyltransferase
MPESADSSELKNPTPEVGTVHRRRRRYAGKYPRRFEEKYKEHDPGQYGETVAKVLASGKTPAGTHRPILVAEVLEVLSPRPGEVGVDATLGWGGHAEALLLRLRPGGRLLGLDADPVQLPRTEARLREAGFGTDELVVARWNFAGLSQALARAGLVGVDFLLADLGLSSMQIDDPARGFSVKFDGPLDMRMNPQRGEPVSAMLERMRPEELEEVLVHHADEPRAKRLASALAGKRFTGTRALGQAIKEAVPGLGKEESDLTIRRVFQALRIEVNDELSVLESLLRQLPVCLKPGGRVAILTFHSGEDRRVKRAFEAGRAAGVYAEVSLEPIRPGPEERRANPRSSPAKLRWARRS